MLNLRYVVPFVWGTEYVTFIKDDVIDGDFPAHIDYLDFNDGKNIFSIEVNHTRFNVMQKRLDIMCKQRIYKRDDQTYLMDIYVLTQLGFILKG